MPNQITKLQDVIVPELFTQYAIDRTAELSRLVESGIVTASAEMQDPEVAAAGADMLVFPTAVPKVAVQFNKPGQRWLDSLSLEEARAYMAAGEFPPGSMAESTRRGSFFALTAAMARRWASKLPPASTSRPSS